MQELSSNNYIDAGEGRGRLLKKEYEEQGFNCGNCGAWVGLAESVGTRNRNHCNKCLWSRHVDLEVSGDRKSGCGGMMQPIALTLKAEGRNKYRKEKSGELMLVHQCSKCGRVSINRIAGDDNERTILNVFKKSWNLDVLVKDILAGQKINYLQKKDEEIVMKQLFGKNYQKVFI
jgi:predicted RNA-binding Zn-ribbon protein involved in translation (DUF1610 family)